MSTTPQTYQEMLPKGQFRTALFYYKSNSAKYKKTEKHSKSKAHSSMVKPQFTFFKLFVIFLPENKNKL